MLNRFKRNSKIPCYVLVYDQVEIISKSLAFLTAYADRLDIIVIENPSDNTPAISKIVETYGKNSRVTQYYLFDENITNNAFDLVLQKEERRIKNSPYVIVTDGDLTCSDTGWLAEELGILAQNVDVFACGISLDRSNLPLASFPDADTWIPADVKEFDTYNEARTGAHLLCMRGPELYDFMQWKHGKDISFRDGELHKYAYGVLHKRWARTKHATAYHLTWDLYQDKKHPYTKLKTGKSFSDTWSHQQTASYSLKTYS